MTPVRRPLAVLLAVGALALAGCTSTPHATVETPKPAPTVTVTFTATPTPEPATAPTAEYPTADTIDCDGMLVPAVAETLRSVDMAPAPKPWTQFNFEATGAALECPWAFEGEAHSRTYYAWAELGAGEAEEFIALTTGNGYTTETDDHGTWIIWPVDDGSPTSGILVTDEWVAFADNAELIDNIVWTQSDATLKG